MSTYEWIICERRDQWSAAISVAIKRHARSTIPTPRIYELRSLKELTERLAAKSNSLALIEVHHGNLAQVLGWSARLPIWHPHARFIGLIDRSLASPDEFNASLASERSRLVNVLLEAGAVEIVFSPRQLPSILPIAYKHAEIWESRRAASDKSQAISDWAWSLLPWQTA